MGAQQKPGLEIPTTAPVAACGAARIFIELEDTPEEAKRYGEKYTALVRNIADALRNGWLTPPENEINPYEEIKFFEKIRDLLKNDLGIHYGVTASEFISESLDTRKWDCDASAFLVFDVAREVELPIQMIFVPGQEHVLVATENICFESPLGVISPRLVLPLLHPKVSLKTSDPEKIHSLSFFSRGMVRLKKEDYDRAIADFNEAIRRNPVDQLAYNNRGLAYSHKGDYTRAVEDYTEAIRLNPKDASAYSNRGNTYSYMGDYDRAMKDFNKAVRLTPKDSRVYNNRGNSHSDKGDYKRAIKDYSRAISLDPKNADAYKNRGIEYSYLGDQAKAQADYGMAARLRQASQ